MAIRPAHALGTAIGLAVLSTASFAQAQSIPRAADFGRQLPEIPLTAPVTMSDVMRRALPGSAARGVTVAPGVVVDRTVRPRCIFIANQNQGNGSVRQSAEIGQLQLYCP